LSLNVEVDMFAKSELQSAWTILYLNDTQQEVTQCSLGTPQCTGFLLISEDSIQYPFFEIAVRFIDPNTTWISQVEFQVWYQHIGFSTLEMGFRVTYLIITTFVIMFLLFRIYNISYNDWSWEQRAAVLLLIGLVLYNNPFFPFIYVTGGWFFPFLNALLEVSFMCILLSFWLFVVNNLKEAEEGKLLDYTNIAKLAYVSIFGLLCLTLFSWISIRTATNPVFSAATTTGIQILFYICALIWTCGIVWSGVMIAIAISRLIRRPHMTFRFFFFAIPTGFVILSLIIGILAGSWGPYNRSTIQFVFYTGLYNVYVLILTWGYWPLKETRFTERNPTESTPLTL